MIGMKNVDETEEEDIPEEVLNNITNKQEKLTKKPEEEENNILLKPTGKDDSLKKQKTIKYLFIIFAIINNAFPFVTSIIEIILRAVNDHSFNVALIIEIFYYVIIALCFIKHYLRPSIGRWEVGCGSTAFCLLVFHAFLMQIIGLSSDEYSKDLEGFTLFFYEFRVYGIIIVICNDIILAFINCHISSKYGIDIF